MNADKVFRVEDAVLVLRRWADISCWFLINSASNQTQKVKGPVSASDGAEVGCESWGRRDGHEAGEVGELEICTCPAVSIISVAKS